MTEAPRADAPQPRPRRARGALRWTGRLLLTALAARLLLWGFLLPLVQFGAGLVGLTVSWRSASLSVLSLSAHIVDLELREVGSDREQAPLLRARDVFVDVSTRALLSGQVRVVDAAIGGAEVCLRRAPDGALRLPASWSAEPPVALPDEPLPPTDQGPLDLRLPFTVTSLRVHDLEVSSAPEDGAASPVCVARINLDVADLGAPTEECAVTLRAALPGICDELKLEARGRNRAADAAYDLRGSIRGARPAPFALPERALALLGAPHVVDLTLDGAVSARVLPGAPRSPALGGDVTLQLDADGRDHAALEASFGPTQGAADGLRLPLAASARLAGVVEQLELRDATLELGEGRASITGTVTARALRPGPLADDLTALGLQLPAAGVDLRAAADVEVGESLTLAVTDVALDTQAGRALALPELAIQDLRFLDDVLAVERVAVSGPELAVRRDAAGTWSAAGISFTPPLTPAAASDAPTDRAPRPLPKLRIGAVAWSGAALSLTDDELGADGALLLTDLDLRGDGLAFGVAAPPGRIQLSFRAPTALRSFRSSATLAPRPDGAALRLELSARGVTLDPLRPWLEPRGVDAALRDGALDLVATADLQRGQAPTLDVELRDLVLRDGDVRWLALSRLRASGVTFGQDARRLGEWEADGLDLLLRTDAEGRTLAGGLRFGGPRPEPLAAAPGAPAAAGAPLQHGALTLRDGTLRWEDAASPGSPRALRAQLQVGPQAALDAPVDISARVDLLDSTASLQLDAHLHRAAGRLAASGDLSAAGLSASTVSWLLPQGCECTLRDGALAAQVDVDLDLADGGTSLAVRSLQLRDGEELLAAAEILELDAPQLDAQRVHVRRLVADGVQAVIARDGARVEVPGFALSPRPAPQAQAPQPPPGSPAAMRLPPLTLGEVAVELDELTFEDRQTPERPPLRVRGSLQLDAPWSGAPEAPEHAPMRWRLRAAAAPGGASLTADLTANPFTPSPTLDAALEVAGLDTTKLPQVLDGWRGEATALRLRALLHARLDLRRRDVGVFDLARAFGGELIIQDFELDDAASGETFARADAIDVVARAVDLRSGDVLLRSVDFDEPFVATRRDAAGLHVAGFVRPPQPDPADAAAPAGPPPPRAREATAPAEVAVDRLRITGLGYDHRDSTTTPPTHLRVVDSDGELAEFSTDAWTATRPLSFSATVRGGDVELDRRLVDNSVLRGLMRSGVAMMTGGSGEAERELRPLVDRLHVEGQLVLWPRLEGRVRASVDRLELAALRGLAGRSRVRLAGGLYDARAALDFRGYDGVDIRSDHVFTWLAIEEPPNGPLATYLRLPAPLQTVLFLLRNQNDEQRVPLNVRVPRGEQGRAAIAEALKEALAKLIGSAMTSAAPRAASAVKSALLGGGGEVPALADVVSFAPGSPLPNPAALEPLAAALAADPSLVLVLEHHVGAADMEHARRLANPPAPVVQQTVRKLERRRRALEAQRAPLAQDVTALYGAGQVQEAVQLRRELERVETELGELLEALGGAYEHLDGDNPRAAARRTRDAARALAEARLDAVAATLARRAPAVPAERIERRPGRSLPTAGLERGGQVVATLRRRAADANGPSKSAPSLRR